MADVSHELGALRFVVESPLSSKVAMFNNAVSKHQESQHLNPFSQTGGLPKPTFNKGEYGKPLAGSLTEMRGQKANIHVLKEMLELCQIIDSEGYNVKDEPTMKVIPFGELFNIYTYISDKVVGILLRARKHKLIDFEGEVLFQRRDDDVPVFLLKPIKEIRQILEQKQEEIRRSVSPAPQATSVMMDQRKMTPSPSPTPQKQKTKDAAAKTEIIKPIARKAVPTIEIQGDQAKPDTKVEEPKKPTEAPKVQAPAAPAAGETPKPTTESAAQATPKAAEVIASSQALPETIVTPPTPTAESPAVSTVNAEQKTDLNNNDKAPAIVVPNASAEPEAVVPTTPNVA